MLNYKYIPTRKEKVAIRIKPNTFKVSGDHVFFTLQGEGQSIGKPAIFLRLHLCNLQCKWCDTKYTWDSTIPQFWRESSDWDLAKIVKKLRSYGYHRLVITGGEPLIQQETIIKLLALIPDWFIEIETNGTIMPNAVLCERCQLNVSPKLENSGNPKTRRYKPEVLRFVNNLEGTTFKFVVTQKKDIPEIETLIKECQLNPNKIIIMPEGRTVHEIKRHSLKVIELVKKKGWRLLPRLQVTLWGTKRGI